MSVRVSLAMPVFNGARYLALALDNILAQDFSDFELIITDNASTDATAAICQAYAARDPRIRYFRNERNLGATPNFNRGIELATGEYFKWCAHDDLLSPNFVSACVAILDADRDVALATGRVQAIDDEGHPVPWQGCGAPMQGPQENAVDRFYHAVAVNVAYQVFGVHRLSTLRKTTLYRPYYSSDRALVAESALLGKSVEIPNATFYFRVHPGADSMQDRLARSRAESTTRARLRVMENFSLMTHLFEIAWRHKDVARRAAIWRLVQFYSRPKQFARTAYDLVYLISPRAGDAMKRFFVFRGQTPNAPAA